MSANIFLKEFIKRAIATQAQIQTKPKAKIKIAKIPQKPKLKIAEVPKLKIHARPRMPAKEAIKLQPPRLIETPKPKKNLLQSVSINELMQNPAVTSLECKGPNIPLIIKTRAGPSTINKTLSLEEINDIIQKFSEESRIPIVSEVFRAIVNNMMITASLSNPEAPQFIITKLSGK